MLAIRLQRTGRKGLANFRIVVQDAARSPSSGRVVAQIGHYNPHTKDIVLDKEKAKFYLENGAQPSPRVVALMKSEKVELPDWVKGADEKKRETKKPDKLRKNQPKEEQKVEEPAAPEADEASNDGAEPEVAEEAAEQPEATGSDKE